MASVSDGKTVTVFKFMESGLVALCDEVNDLVADSHKLFSVLAGCDLSSARYHNDDGNHNIVFDRYDNARASTS